MSKPKDERYTVAVDFDGVIHSYTTPWKAPEVIPDPPIPGAIEWLEEIAKDFKVVIFTTRGKDLTGQIAVRDWLHEWGASDEFTRDLVVTDEKPPALIYLDDRGWRFTGAFPNKAQIHLARPWKVGEPIRGSAGRISGDGFDIAKATRVEGDTSVVIQKLDDDPICLRASLGGNAGEGYYLTFRGERDKVLHLLESALAAFRRAENESPIK